MVAFIISTFNPMGFFEVGIQAYFYMLVGTISLWLGFISYKIKKREKYVDTRILEMSSDRILSGWLFLLFILGFCCFCLPFVPKAILIAQAQGAAEMDNKDEIIFGGGSLVTITYNIGMAIASKLAVAALGLAIVTKKIKKYFFVAIVCVVLQVFYFILSGARGGVMAVIYNLLFVYLCVHANEKKLNVKPKQVILFTTLFIGVFYLMTLVSNFRMHGRVEMDKSEQTETNKYMAQKFLDYSLAPINLFDISLKENYFDKLDGYRFGKATFAGVDFFINSVAKRVGVDYETDLYIVDYLQEHRKRCSKDHDYNYVYSMFFFNYMDFGFLGILVLPFIFGLTFRYVIGWYYRFTNFPRLLMVVLFFGFMISSHMTSPFIRPWDMLYLAIIIMWDKLDRVFNVKSYKRCLV